MLVTKVPMNSHPKIRPVRRKSTIDSSFSASSWQEVGAIVAPKRLKTHARIGRYSLASDPLTMPRPIS
jgi:hypothetical protein